MNRWFNNFPFLGKYLPGKIILSFLMLLLAVILDRLYPTIGKALCVFAMFFSFIGDYSLNRVPEIGDRTTKDFVIGAMSFIIAHVFYCIAYGYKSYIHGFELFNVGAIISIVILVIVTYFIIKKADAGKKSKLLFFGILYLWLTGINYATIFSYAISIKSIESLVFVGGLLFLASDVIIGFEKFANLKSPVARELVWWFYPIGQILLIIMV